LNHWKVIRALGKFNYKIVELQNKNIATYAYIFMDILFNKVFHIEIKLVVNTTLANNHLTIIISIFGIVHALKHAKLQTIRTRIKWLTTQGNLREIADSRFGP
jgi:hypothetical protein